MINKILKIKKKIFLIKNLYNFLIKIGFQKKTFLSKKYLLKNCIINTWLKFYIKKDFFYIFGYSNSLLISGILKIISKIINKTLFKNIFILIKYDLLKIILIKNKITKNKIENLKKIFYYIFSFLLKR